MDHFFFGSQICAKADPKMNNRTAQNLWFGFTCHGSTIEFAEGMKNTFTIGNAAMPQLSADEDYAINIEESGAVVVGSNYRGLMEGYTALLTQIEPINLEDGEERFRIKCQKVSNHYKIKNRMVHYCVFPETDLETIRREIRLAGVLHYTHIVLEFWGMFPYDCLKELSWPNAFSKDTVRELIREIREFGMEPIPFVNHMGHASMSRHLSGKHVVLDQNPKLQTYYLPSGWDWNIYNEKTVKLLKAMREELMEVFGDGEYFHIGCDESDGIAAGKDMAQYLRELTRQVEKEGRKPMLWGDMLVSLGEISERISNNAEELKKYHASSRTAEEINIVLQSLSENAIIVDWQYDVTQAPIPSFKILRDKGCRVMEAPWYESENCRASLETVSEYGGCGYMLTTWHYIRESYRAVVESARMFGFPKIEWTHEATTITAALLRKVTFEKISYEQAGLCEKQLGYTPL